MTIIYRQPDGQRAAPVALESIVTGGPDVGPNFLCIPADFEFHRHPTTFPVAFVDVIAILGDEVDVVEFTRLLDEDPPSFMKEWAMTELPTPDDDVVAR